MDAKNFRSLFSTVAKSNSFHYVFGGWIKKSSESIVVLNLQKSNFGNYFELNIKIFIQGAFDNIYVENNELVKKHTGTVFRRPPEMYSDALNLDKLFSNQEREMLLSQLFLKFIVPLTDKALSRVGISFLEEHGELFIPPAVKMELSRLNRELHK